MRKAIVFLAIMLVFCAVALAQGKDERLRELIQETQKMDQMILQYQNEINRLSQMRLENIGRIKELGRIKEEEEKPADKNDKKAR